MLKSMSAIIAEHPIKRIRESFKATPEEFGLRGFSSSQGFASWLGRSSSLIRNVECGIKPNWEKLAKLVESKTGVSHEWMLSSPSPREPIMGVNGKPWSAIEHLDPLAGADGCPNWRLLLMTSPKSLARLAATMAETKITIDLSLTGSSTTRASIDATSFFAGFLKLLESSGAFKDTVFMDAITKAFAFEKQTSGFWEKMCPQGSNKGDSHNQRSATGKDQEPEKRVGGPAVRARTRIILDDPPELRPEG